MKLKNWIQSSQDPIQISQSVKGGVLVLSSIILFVAMNFFGVEIEQASINDFGVYLGMIAGGVYGLAGVIMKIAMKFGKKEELT